MTKIFVVYRESRSRQEVYCSFLYNTSSHSVKNEKFCQRNKNYFLIKSMAVTTCDKTLSVVQDPNCFVAFLILCIHINSTAGVFTLLLYDNWLSRNPMVCVYFDIIHMDYQKCSLEYDIVIWLGKGQLSPEYSIIEMFCFVMPAHIEENLDRPAGSSTITSGILQFMEHRKRLCHGGNLIIEFVLNFREI